MNREELKQEIKKRTGVPADLLSGTTTKEIMEQAKALLTDKKEQRTSTILPEHEAAER